MESHTFYLANLFKCIVNDNLLTIIYYSINIIFTVERTIFWQILVVCLLPMTTFYCKITHMNWLLTFIWKYDSYKVYVANPFSFHINYCCWFFFHKENKALSIVSYIGCAISIICLLIAICLYIALRYASHVHLWNYVSRCFWY